MDAPQDPKAFSHRSGRAARAGRQGRATIFLNRGREEYYVDFLKLRKIPMERGNYRLADGQEKDNLVEVQQEEGEKKMVTERVDDPSIKDFVRSLRDIVKTDRKLHDRSLKAFVSWVQAYSKHEANYIFRLKDVDLDAVATGFGLLKVNKRIFNQLFFCDSMLTQNAFA